MAAWLASNREDDIFPDADGARPPPALRLSKLREDETAFHEHPSSHRASRGPTGWMTRDHEERIHDRGVATMANPSIVLVTGASSGIGEAIAARLAQDGHQVFGTSRKGGTRDGNEMLTLDVCSDASVQSCVEGLLRKKGRIDALVNNAGYLLSGAIEEATLEEARLQLETNFFGVVRMVKAVLPAMRRARSGHIVTISSLAGLVPVPFWGFYNASKFAVEGYMETLRHELKPFGIRVAMVEPGVIRTPFYENPQAKPMPEYAPWRDRALKTTARFAEKAPGPGVVAEVVAGLLASRNPPLRNRITREASIFSLLRWLLPASAFEAGARRSFNLDREGF
jgi:NAD(P)-dependent dehydrogenase (short-subunit alcohol dehydrogenase family)